MRIADAAQLYVGLEHGFYASEGLRIEIQEFQKGSQVLDALASRSGESVDIGFPNLVALLASRARGSNMVTFAGGPVEDASRPTHGLLVSRNSSVVRPKDLAGKKIAVNALKNVEDLMLTRHLRQVSVDPSSATVVEIAFPQMPAALKTGQVDAACDIEPYLTAALREGASRLLAHHYGIVAKRIAIATYSSIEDKVNSRRDEFASSIVPLRWPLTTSQVIHRRRCRSF